MPISDELKRVYASAPDDDYYIETLELRHSGLTNGARFVTNQQDGLTGQLEDGSPVVYEFAPFSAIPPRSEEENNLTLQVAIDNASRSLMEELEAMAELPTEPIVVYYRVYLASDPNTVQNDPPLKLDIMNVNATQSVISFNAGITNLRQRPFPSMLYTTALYPGLAR